MKRRSEWRVGLVIRERMFREALAALLTGEPGLTLAITDECLGKATRHPSAARVAVWIVDLDSASDDEDEIALRSITVAKTDYPSSFFIAVVGSARQELALELFDSCVSKRDSFSGLLEQLRRLQRFGRSTVSRRLDATARDRQHSLVADESRTVLLDLLTKRELEVLRHLALGHSAKSSAEALCVAPSTLENHKANIMKKLRVHKSTELVRIAIRDGIVEA